MRLAAAALLACACSGIPSIPDQPFTPPKPSATPLQLCWAETGRASSWGGYATSGWSSTKTWNATASILVVRHPKGDVLIDTGKSFRLEEEKKALSLSQRVLADQIMGPLQDVARAPDALKAVGEDPSKVKWIILSHVHGDHAGGLPDLPDTPVFMPEEEIYFANKLQDAGTFFVFKDQVEALAGRALPIKFEDVPYEIFPRSADLFGDGSIVVVPLFGHTPGSVGVFVNAGPHLRVLHIGDITVVREGFERPAPKGKFLAVTDLDPERTAKQVALLHQLHEKDPELKILPAHDRDAWIDVFGAEAPTCTK